MQSSIKADQIKSLQVQISPTVLFWFVLFCFVFHIHSHISFYTWKHITRGWCHDITPLDEASNLPNATFLNLLVPLAGLTSARCQEPANLWGHEVQRWAGEEASGGGRAWGVREGSSINPLQSIAPQVRVGGDSSERKVREQYLPLHMELWKDSGRVLGWFVFPSAFVLSASIFPD